MSHQIQFPKGMSGKYPLLITKQHGEKFTNIDPSLVKVKEFIDKYPLVYRYLCNTVLKLAKREINDLTDGVCNAINKNECSVAANLVENPLFNPNQHRTSDMALPLMEAVSRGCTTCVKNLLKHPLVDPNLTDSTDCTPLYMATLTINRKIIDLLLQHPKIDPFIIIDQNQDISPFTIPLLFNDAPQLSYGRRNHQFDSCETVSWTHVSIFPISCDESHSPPKEFVENVRVVNRYVIQNSKFGQIECINSRDSVSQEGKHYIRIIYTTETFQTISLLERNQPLGPTIYRPLFPILKSVSVKQHLLNNPDIWHISKQCISNAYTLKKILKFMAERNLLVFRSLNADRDVVHINKGESLSGRGNSRNIASQIKGDKTALLSVSTRPLSTFMRGHKDIKNGGFVAIFTKRGAKLFLGSQPLASYPQFATHDQVLGQVKHDSRLTQRARQAKEAMFLSPVPLDFVVFFDRGFPTIGRSTQIRPKSAIHLSKRIIKLLNDHNKTFQSVPKEIQDLLLSNKSEKNKLRELTKFLINESC